MPWKSQVRVLIKKKGRCVFFRTYVGLVRETLSNSNAHHLAIHKWLLWWSNRGSQILGAQVNLRSIVLSERSQAQKAPTFFFWYPLWYTSGRSEVARACKERLERLLNNIPLFAYMTICSSSHNFNSYCKYAVVWCCFNMAFSRLSIFSYVYYYVFYWIAFCLIKFQEFFISF